ncbi:ATP-binding cassette domain-containing protein, partial [Rhodococcus sp. CX]|nr:ATP-binding cassette domain-containing protein [Rhodococcus sp. CX]
MTTNESEPAGHVEQDSTTQPAADALLEVASIRAGYGPVPVLHDVSLRVGRGEVVVLLGANGAGKTTTLRALCGVVRASGSVRFDGEELVGQSTRTIAIPRRAMVPQGRGTFKDLSVLENLAAGAFLRRSRSEV